MNLIIALKVKFDKIDIEKDMAPHQSAHPASSGQKTMSIRVYSLSKLNIPLILHHVNQ